MGKRYNFLKENNTIILKGDKRTRRKRNNNNNNNKNCKQQQQKTQKKRLEINRSSSYLWTVCVRFEVISSFTELIKSNCQQGENNDFVYTLCNCPLAIITAVSKNYIHFLLHFLLIFRRGFGRDEKDIAYGTSFTPAWSYLYLTFQKHLLIYKCFNNNKNKYL